MRTLEIDAVSNWYDREGRQPTYWQPSPTYEDQMDPTRERVLLGCEVHCLIERLEQEDMPMAYHIASGLPINLKKLVAEMIAPGMAAHIARNKTRH